MDLAQSFEHVSSKIGHIFLPSLKKPVPSLAIIRGAQRPAPLKVRPALFISAL